MASILLPGYLIHLARTTRRMRIRGRGITLPRHCRANTYAKIDILWTTFSIGTPASGRLPGHGGIPQVSNRASLITLQSRQETPRMDLADNLALGPVTVVLPTYNEEAGIGPQIEAIRQALEQHGIEHEILVIDDGSEDKTALAATAAGARLMCNLENRGYGASLKTGIQAATYPTIVITDADGTYPSDQIPALLARLQTADMAVGSRTGKHVKIPLIRRPAKWMLGWLANRIAGRRIPDLNSGLRAFRRNVVEQYFGILSDRFSFTTTVTLALLADGYRVVYHPIDYYARVGKSKIKPVDFMEFLILVLRLAILFQPLRIFVPLSAAVGGLGVLKVVLDVIAFFPRQSGADWSLWYNAVLSTSALLLLLVAFQLLLIGMVADAVIRKIGQHVPRVPSHAPVSSEQAPGHLSSKEGHVAP